MKRFLKYIGDRMELPFRKRQLELLEKRKTYNKEQFLNCFSDSGIDNDISSVVWDSFLNEAVIDSFPPKPEDDILKIYGLADDDLDELVLLVLEKCKCRIPSSLETKKMKPVNSISDLVEFVARMRG